MPVTPTPRGYTSAYLVSDAIGAHTGEAPVDSLDFWMAAAENWIDLRAQRSWGITTIVAEQQNFDARAVQHAPAWSINPLRWTPNNGWADPLVYLRTYPVTAVSAVRARYLSLGATTFVLPGSDYEIIDGPKGWLLVSTNWVGYRLSIDYTVNVPVPPAITLAATQLVVSWIQPMLVGTDSKALSGIKSYSIGQDLSVTFQDSASSSAMVMGAPKSVTDLVDQYRIYSPVV
jgi:hypothetical protein